MRGVVCLWGANGLKLHISPAHRLTPTVREGGHAGVSTDASPEARSASSTGDN